MTRLALLWAKTDELEIDKGLNLIGLPQEVANSGLFGSDSAFMTDCSVINTDSDVVTNPKTDLVPQPV